MKSETNRRNRLDLMTPAEKAIYEATQEVEKMPAAETLTNAVILLGQPRNLVANYVDDHPVETPKPLTWAELKKFANTLTDEQLGLPVRAFIDDEPRARDVNFAETMGRDIYMHVDDDDDAGTLSDLQELHGEEFERDKYALVTPADRPFLFLTW